MRCYSVLLASALMIASNSNAGNTLQSGQGVGGATVITSSNGQYSLSVDGNGSGELVVLRSNGSTRAMLGRYGFQATLMSDGDFRLYNGPGAMVWHTGTATGKPTILTIHDNGNLTIEVTTTSPRTLMWQLGPDDGTYQAVAFASPPGFPPSNPPGYAYNNFVYVQH